MAEQAAASKISEQTAQGGVLAKLAIFSLSLAVLPVTAYFGTQWYLGSGNTIYPAISAVIIANIILVSYVIVAIREDAAGRQQAKKDQ
ncbi:hypothetical protein FRC19_004865 [Serendipita sp. 401]|nr:hypothetical protein FRC15_008767 [Serendipita sp. 397]KAG8764811.1 hypothetical protein FRC16_008252 [Serendipita sp. 398]KAG8804004.1 hypothetical protein FRC18_007185 [Serendipita sp. 400]KAG8822988.1 hypothetical protein FRC19_004865 [Serendipita sp. 401]KAG9055067.1 hypothetical protein FS842_003259 [Serendipita sp. 407]